MSESHVIAPQPLADFVDLAFARRLEMAETIFPYCVESLRNSSPARPFAYEQVAGGVAFYGGPDSPTNQMVGMGLYGEVADDDLDRVEEFFRSRGVASTIVVSPLADMSLLSLLGQRGYSVVEFNSVLVRPIRADGPFAPPAGIAIERVTPATIPVWTEVIAEGFAQQASVAREVFAGFATLPGALPFLATIGDTVVGGAGGRIIAEAGIAALYGAATLPAFRNLGVQSALIARRLHEAALAGCEYAVVSTQPASGSQRNMERRGFRLAYTKLVMSRSWPEAAPAAKGADHGHRSDSKVLFAISPHHRDCAMGSGLMFQGGWQAVRCGCGGHGAATHLLQVHAGKLRRAVRAAGDYSRALHGAGAVGKSGTAKRAGRRRVARTDFRILPTGVGAAAPETAR